MVQNILALWPVIRWVLQALGFLGPEDRERENEYKLRLMEAAERREAALIESFAEFQRLWRPSADRVYAFANTVIALLQPTILALVYYDVIWGRRQSVQTAVDLERAGIPGLLIMAIMLFPFYGPALVQAVGLAFQSAVDLAMKKRGGGGVLTTVEPAGRPVVTSGTPPLSSSVTRPTSKPTSRLEPVDASLGERHEPGLR